MKTKAFQGPNGWYVAEVDDEGFHRQPEFGGTLTEAQARRIAEQCNQRDSDES